ncbi:MAG TPA: glucose 1-dehydrogenase [Candidatus Binataceae bacterium]|jgi:2,5-dichloro-2,5-cyclohexadiene-1,4-diol dehydrogenase 2|nr:glucose 1-dehydrogenase [Candidatus Binataceae bacterium]
MAGRLSGKVALITGGAAGMGAAFVRVFAAEGAKVVAADIQDELGPKVAEGVNRAGGEAIYLHLDISRQRDWTIAVAETVRRFGKLTTLCNVAGIYRTEGTETETMEGWDQLIAINQTGVWLGMKAAIPEMKKAGGGAIVNISSVAGLSARPMAIAYHAAKAAVHLMSKVAALEYAREGIRVNSIHPGFTMTSTASALPEDMKKMLADPVPIGRAATPEEIAYGALYLCSDEAAIVTGTELVIDGGLSARH